MKKGIAIWFVVGFVSGLGSLLVAISFLPGGWLRKEHPQEISQSGVEKQIQSEMLGLFQRANRLLDRAEKEFTEVSDDARESALLSDLQTVRSQLELYKIQHLDKYPGTDPSSGSFDGELFKSQLTKCTNGAGEVGSDPSKYPFGPYLLKLPSNPFAAKNAESAAGGKDEVGDGSTGWYFNTITGKFSPNDPGHKHN